MQRPQRFPGCLWLRCSEYEPASTLAPVSGSQTQATSLPSLALAFQELEQASPIRWPTGDLAAQAHPEGGMKVAFPFCPSWREGMDAG